MIDPTRIAHRESGAGAPVLLLHGSASNARQWRWTVEYLHGRFRTITADLPGYGASDPIPGKQPAPLADVAAELIPLVAAQGRPVHLVGHSFGGAVALKLSGLLPEAVASLTLIEPAAFGPFWGLHGSDAVASRPLRAMSRAFTAALAGGDAWGATRLFFDFWNGPGAWARSSFDIQRKLASTAGQVWRDFQALDQERTDAAELARVAAPAQVIRGADSPAVMAALCDHLAEVLPGAAQSVVPGAGHMVPLTHPHVIDPMIGDFLVRAERRWQDANTDALEELAA